MSTFDEIRQTRIGKLNDLRDAKVDPYPLETPDVISVEKALAGFSKLKGGRRNVAVAGRLIARREHGGSIFGDIFDGEAKIQTYFKKDALGEESFNLFRDKIDVGDFIFCKGKPFLTKRKEKTLEVVSWRILAKSLRPLPEKWHGLQDVEERFRKRYLDFLMNEEVRERFLARPRIISEIRKFLEESGYMEVETPVLQPLAGGALAEPFKTHHNALDIDLYLRIAKELYLKQLLIGGMKKIFEIGRDFRNEGIDATHNPEFTMLEFYEAYSDAAKQRVFVEKMFKRIIKKVIGKSVVESGGLKIDFSKKFAVVAYLDLLKRYALIANPEFASRDDIAITAKRLGVNVGDKDVKEKIMDNIYKKICRPRLIQPTFIVDYPAEFSPFAKRDPQNYKFIDRFQLVAGGMELVNAFSELNDPIDQRERFLEQDRKRQMGEAEVSPSDETFLEAMEYGMPPAGGVGMGIDRLVMLLTGTQNIREVVLFPTLRPKQQ